MKINSILGEFIAPSWYYRVVIGMSKSFSCWLLLLLWSFFCSIFAVVESFFLFLILCVCGGFSISKTTHETETLGKNLSSCYNAIREQGIYIRERKSGTHHDQVLKGKITKFRFLIYRFIKICYNLYNEFHLNRSWSSISIFLLSCTPRA